jgi:F0F1-type ATP synthase assembly protein I
MPKRDEPSLGHFMGLGLQVAIGVGLGLWVGSWLDRRFGWTPWGMLVCAMLGMAGGMYLLIKEAIRANKD